MELRKAIPYHKTGINVDAAFDGPEFEARIPADAGAAVLRQYAAWVDPEKDADTKAAYRFGHHMVDADGKVGDASYRGCVIGIAELNGARGGTTIPDADRQGVYDHLAHHIRDAGKEPPELKTRAAGGQRERRAFRLDAVEVREGAAGTPVLAGHASVFDSPAEIGGGFFMDPFTEVVRAGAFAKTIQENDIRSLWNHNSDLVLGRKKAGTLSLAEDSRGLAVEITPPDTQWGRDAVTSIRRGDVDQMSIMFEPIRELWDVKANTRELLEIKLWEVSPVTFPAFEATDIGVRSALAAAGVDWTGLARALALSQRGQPFDRGIVAASVEALSALLAGAPGESSHPPEPEAWRLQAMRRRLELAERS